MSKRNRTYSIEEIRYALESVKWAPPEGSPCCFIGEALDAIQKLNFPHLEPLRYTQEQIVEMLYGWSPQRCLGVGRYQLALKLLGDAVASEDRTSEEWQEWAIDVADKMLGNKPWPG